jgi:hypothetical protein
MKVAVPSARTALRASRVLGHDLSAEAPDVQRRFEQVADRGECFSWSPGVSRSRSMRSSTSWVVARLPADWSTKARSGAGWSTCILR